MYVLLQELFESTMRTKVLLQPLVLLVLVHGIETQYEAATETTTTEDDVIFTQYQSESKFNTTEYNHPLKNQKSSATGVHQKTAGNSFCRSDHTCGYHEGQAYSFCYVDYSDNWDYCCTGKCDYHEYSYLWCASGNKWQYCGDAGLISIDGTPCHYLHPCGMHQEKGKDSTYWCYVDHRLNWRRCCAPSSKCDYYGYNYKWCYTGYKKETSAYECFI
ncbi:hypothetical protein ACJMK2_018246 [Sinanodonta woodiana]|uniref:Uncharacterized protein n=1 Tax=Sinanodonta woodiana TaxID=1069815 RepID=A0ABD3UEH9_SINWO